MGAEPELIPESKPEPEISEVALGEKRFTIEEEFFTVEEEFFSFEEEIVVAPDPARRSSDMAATPLAAVGGAARSAADADDAAAVSSAAEAQEAPVEEPPHRRAMQLVLLVSFTLDTLLYSLVVPFLPARATALGASAAVTGALFASYAAGLFLATPLAGLLTDRSGPRRVLLVGLVALLLSTLLFAFAPGLALLVLARTAQGAAGAITWTAGLALIAQVYDAQERTIVFARAFTVVGVGSLIGPPLGGALYTWGGFRLPFLFAAALVLLDGIGRLIFIPGKDTLNRPQPTPGAIRNLLRRRRFLAALVAVLAGAAIIALLEPTVPILLSGRFGLSSLVIGIIFGAIPIAYILAQPLVLYVIRHLGAEFALVFGLLASGLAIILVAASQTLDQEAVALAVVAFAAGFALVPSLELLTAAGQTDGPNATPYGALYAAYNLAYAGGIFFGPLLSGGATTAFGLFYGQTLSSAPRLLLGVFWLPGALKRI